MLRPLPVRPEAMQAGHMKPFPLLAALLLMPASLAPASEPLVIPSLPAAVGIRPTWQWPLTPRPPVLRFFDPPLKPWLSGHRGVDLGTRQHGAEVRSPAPGIVSFAGMVVDRPVITIDHGNGLRSSFEPVASSLAAGSAVGSGQPLGTLLAGHCPVGSCLHWGVRQGGDYVNPLRFVMDLRPSILLPVEASAPGRWQAEPAGRNRRDERKTAAGGFTGRGFHGM